MTTTLVKIAVVFMGLLFVGFQAVVFNLALQHSTGTTNNSSTQAEIQALKQSLASLQESQRKSNDEIRKLLEEVIEKKNAETSSKSNIGRDISSLSDDLHPQARDPQTLTSGDHARVIKEQEPPHLVLGHQERIHFTKRTVPPTNQQHDAPPPRVGATHPAHSSPHLQNSGGSTGTGVAQVRKAAKRRPHAVIRKKPELHKKLVKATRQPLSLLSHQQYVAFLHIGKAGGTSFDAMAEPLVNHCCNDRYKYVGKRHFDWTEIDKLTRAQKNNKPVEVVTLLREPVARAVSHFYFWQTMKWMKNSKMYKQTLSDYVLGGDKQNLLETRDIWQDGQAGVSWLTGTHIGDWVVKKITPAIVEEREHRSLNMTVMLPLAAARLRQTKWFGLLEELDRSLILFQHEFNLTAKPNLPSKNSGKRKKHASLNETEHQALASLMPQDMWLYDYAKRLFEARWNAYQTGVYIEPEEPPLPETLPCTSTRFNLICTQGPLAKFFPAGAPPIEIS